MTRIRADRAFVESAWVTDVDILISSDGRVSAIGGSSGRPDHCVDLVLPAPVNLHSHSFQRAMAGLTETRGPSSGGGFWIWRKLMYRFLRQLTPEQIEAIAAQTFMEMAEAGYAAVVEFHYLHHAADGQPYDNVAELSERIASAAHETGLGLTLLPVMYEFGGCDGRPLESGQKRFGNARDRFGALFAAAGACIAEGPKDWGIGIAPHSLRAVDRVGLTLCAELVAGGPFHMHLAEQTAEVDEVEAHFGARPVEWVLDNLAVDASSCFIHCTQMTEPETVGLARSGAVVGLCPITESNLGDGIFSGSRYLGSGGRMGFGSDSNTHISLWQELRTLEYSQRLRDRGRAVLAAPDLSSGRVLFDQALSGGAQASGRAGGGLSVEGWADLIGLSMDNEFLCNRSEDILLDSLIFSGGGQTCIQDVWSAGRHIVRDGRHVARDRIRSRFTSVLRELGDEI